MKGRGLLIAAAVLQLCCAAMALLVATMVLFVRAPVAYVFTGVYGTFGVGMIAVSVNLLYARRWAWWTSVIVMSLASLFVLVAPIAAAVAGRRSFGIGAGEAVIILFVASPIFVTVGLLIGGRAALRGPVAP